MSYEPSKRLVLKNLPPDCTKKDIIDFIKNRSRSQPSNIEIGKRPDGTQNRFAHVTVEGMKALCEVINGIPIKGFPITAEPAKPHFSIAMRDAKRQRENAEAQELAAQEAAREEMLEKIRSGPDQLKGVKVRSFYHYKQKYAEAAKKIAEDGRKGLITRHSYAQPQQPSYEEEGEQAAVGWMTEAEMKAADLADRKRLRTELPPGLKESNYKGKKENFKGKDFKPGAKKEEKKVVVEAPPPPPPEPPKPSKEERKIAGLQAKLLALKAKMGGAK